MSSQRYTPEFKDEADPFETQTVMVTLPSYRRTLHDRLKDPASTHP